MDTVGRRLELLIMEGKGFSRTEIVKHLSQKYECSPHTLWRDFRTKCRWQPSLMEVKDRDHILMKVLNRYEQIYREASFMQLKAENENVKIGAFKVMLDATSKLYEVAVLPEFLERLADLEEKAKHGVFLK